MTMLEPRTDTYVRYTITPPPAGLRWDTPVTITLHMQGAGPGSLSGTRTGSIEYVLYQQLGSIQDQNVDVRFAAESLIDLDLLSHIISGQQPISHQFVEHPVQLNQGPDGGILRRFYGLIGFVGQQLSSSGTQPQLEVYFGDTIVIPWPLPAAQILDAPSKPFVQMGPVSLRQREPDSATDRPLWFQWYRALGQPTVVAGRLTGGTPIGPRRAWNRGQLGSVVTAHPPPSSSVKPEYWYLEVFLNADAIIPINTSQAVLLDWQNTALALTAVPDSVAVGDATELTIVPHNPPDGVTYAIQVRPPPRPNSHSPWTAVEMTGELTAEYSGEVAGDYHFRALMHSPLGDLIGVSPAVRVEFGSDVGIEVDEEEPDYNQPITLTAVPQRPPRLAAYMFQSLADGDHAEWTDMSLTRQTEPLERFVWGSKIEETIQYRVQMWSQAAGGELLATSDPVTVVWSAPAIELAVSDYAPDPHERVQLRATLRSHRDLGLFGYYLYQVSTEGEDGPWRHLGVPPFITRDTTVTVGGYPQGEVRWYRVLFIDIAVQSAQFVFVSSNVVSVFWGGVATLKISGNT